MRGWNGFAMVAGVIALGAGRWAIRDDDVLFVPRAAKAPGGGDDGHG